MTEIELNGDEFALLGAKKPSELNYEEWAALALDVGLAGLEAMQAEDIGQGDKDGNA